MPRRVLHYALGGGLGHLVRARRFLQQSGFASESLIVGAAAGLEDDRVTGGIRTCRVPVGLQSDRSAFRDWLSDCIAAEAPDLVCIDSFPGGIQGELCGLAALQGIELWHLARLLRWAQYAPVVQGALPRFARCLALEALHPPHEHALRQNSGTWAPLQLQIEPSLVEDSRSAAFWLVVHSGPESEVQLLLDSAVEMRRIERLELPILLATQAPPALLPPRCQRIDAHPVGHLLRAARRIFSAAGFNLMAETEPFRGKHVVMPFPRRLDDQFERARRRARRVTADEAGPVQPAAP